VLSLFYARSALKGTKLGRKIAEGSKKTISLRNFWTLRMQSPHGPRLTKIPIRICGWCPVVARVYEKQRGVCPLGQHPCTSNNTQERLAAIGFPQGGSVILSSWTVSIVLHFR
jgi:hypothetical protein